MVTVRRTFHPKTRFWPEWSKPQSVSKADAALLAHSLPTTTVLMGETVQTLEEVWTDVQTIADALHAPQRVSPTFGTGTAVYMLTAWRNVHCDRVM